MVFSTLLLQVKANLIFVCIVEVTLEQRVIQEAEQRKEIAMMKEKLDNDEFEIKELLPEFPHNWERY